MSLSFVVNKRVHYYDYYNKNYDIVNNDKYHWQ